MFIELIRLGKDAELKQAGQTEILSLYAAYDVGFGDKKKPQWIGLTMFGKRAAQVAHMMTKGTLIMATMDEVQVEEYNGKSYLKAKLVEFKFAGGKIPDPRLGSLTRLQEAMLSSQPVSSPSGVSAPQ